VKRPSAEVERTKHMQVFYTHDLIAVATSIGYQ